MKNQPEKNLKPVKNNPKSTERISKMKMGVPSYPACLQAGSGQAFRYKSCPLTIGYSPPTGGSGLFTPILNANSMSIKAPLLLERGWGEANPVQNPYFSKHFQPRLL